jgi:hypothetical protein
MHQYRNKVVSKYILFMVIAILSASLLGISWAQNVTSTQKPITFFPLNEKPFGLSYEDHVKNYWKYVLSIPADKNPGEDPTGERCTYGQNASKNIFYLVGNSGGKTAITCKIPSGLSLLFAIIAVEASQAESPGATIDDLHKIAKNDQDHVTSLFLNLNGTEFKYEDLLKYRTHTGEFDVIFPENAIFGAPPGPSKAVADGYYLITKPLSPGTYNLEFSGSLACVGADCIEPSFVTQNIVKLIVE